MANLITSLRLVLLFFFAAWVYGAPIQWQILNAVFIGGIFLLDGLDGYVARARNETSTFGASYDIAADRVVENVLWLMLVDIGQVPVWVAIVFLTRGILVDSLRSQDRTKAPFDTLTTPLGLWLTKGRAMRFGYAAIKFLAFAWLFTVPAVAAVRPELALDHGPAIQWAGTLLVHAAVALCVLRGLPAVIEKMSGGFASKRAPSTHPATASKFRVGSAEPAVRAGEE